MNHKELTSLLIRYIFLIALVFLVLDLISYLLTPTTIYLSLQLIKLVYHNSVLLTGTQTLFVNGNYITLISACIAIAAYYLLIFLNLTTPMSLAARTKSLAFLILSFLILNIIRIFIFTILFVSGYSFFDLAHEIVWYAGSTLLLVILWFANVLLFRIKEIPIYSDIKEILRDVKNKKKIM